jgi:hypothetical protein
MIERGAGKIQRRDRSGKNRKGRIYHGLKRCIASDFSGPD